MHVAHQSRARAGAMPEQLSIELRGANQEFLDPIFTELTPVEKESVKKSNHRFQGMPRISCLPIDCGCMRVDRGVIG